MPTQGPPYLQSDELNYVTSAALAAVSQPSPPGGRPVLVSFALDFAAAPGGATLLAEGYMTGGGAAAFTHQVGFTGVNYIATGKYGFTLATAGLDMTTLLVIATPQGGATSYGHVVRLGAASFFEVDTFISNTAVPGDANLWVAVFAIPVAGAVPAPLSHVELRCDFANPPVTAVTRTSGPGVLQWIVQPGEFIELVRVDDVAPGVVVTIASQREIVL